MILQILKFQKNPQKFDFLKIGVQIWDKKNRCCRNLSCKVVDFHAYDPRYSILEHFRENIFFARNSYFSEKIRELHPES